MYIIDVLPISKTAPLDTLTYFSAQHIAPGTLVTIPLKNKQPFGLVVRARNAADEKSALRTADFSLKKITNILAPFAFPKSFLDAVTETAHYFVGSIGATLKSLVPRVAFEELQSKKQTPLTPETTTEQVPLEEKTERQQKTTPERMAMQAGEVERFAHYRSMVRSEFAKKRSVIIILPTIEEACRTKLVLEKGIESYVEIFHSSIQKKKLMDIWKRIKTSPHPLLIIGTYHALSAPREDLGIIIVERESSALYKLQHAPYVDVRFFAERLAYQARAVFVLGDILLRVETAERVFSGELSELAPLQWRALTSAAMHISNMHTHTDPSLQPHQREKKQFRSIGKDLATLVEKTHEENARMIVFAGRKGLAPTTTCNDCNSVVTCTNCSAPVLLKRGAINESGEQSENYFLCNKCGERRSALERCKTCDGWRLTPLGIGIELVEQELRTTFPHVPVFRIDKDHTKNEAVAEKSASAFYATPGAILLMTELGFLYTTEQVEYTAVASIDSLFALPDFRIAEKAFSTLIRLRTLATRGFLVQTRMADLPIFDYAKAGSLIDFYRHERAERKTFHYPPDTLLIKISIEGDREKTYEAMTRLKEILSPHEFEIYPAFIKTVRNKFILHGLLRLPSKEWPNEKLRHTLHSLQKPFFVRVDPESLL